MKDLRFNIVATRKKSYKDIFFDYDKERGQQLNINEPGEGEGTALDSLDFKQPWNTDMLNRPFIDKKDKEEESLDSTKRDGLSLWI
jgi:hypothetical protein